MRFANQINSIKKLQDTLVETEGDIKTETAKLEKDINKVIAKLLKEEFPTIKFIVQSKLGNYDWLVNVQSGCLTDKWKPEVFFYSIAGIHLCKRGWYKNTLKSFEIVKPPIPTNKFLIFLKYLSKEIGVNCRMVRQEPYHVMMQDAYAQY